MAEPFYITTAINYPNGRPHVGHAYEAIATDAIARFQKGHHMRVTGTITVAVRRKLHMP